MGGPDNFKKAPEEQKTNAELVKQNADATKKSLEHGNIKPNDGKAFAEKVKLEATKQSSESAINTSPSEKKDGFKFSPLPADKKTFTSVPAEDTKLKTLAIEKKQQLTPAELTKTSGILETNILSLLKNITGKDIKNIYDLDSNQKASLVYQLAVIKELNHDEILTLKNGYPASNINNPGKKIPSFFEIYTGLNNGKKIGNNSDEINLKDVVSLKNILMKGRQEQMKSLYKSFFKKEGDMPPIMPNIYSLATGDGSDTKGFGGVKNAGRWAFDYGKNLSQTNNSLSFGLEDGKPLNILLSPKGEDEGGGGKITLTMESPDKSKKYLIEGIYKDGKLNFTQDQIPPEVKTGNNNIIMPNIYKDRSMNILTASNKFQDQKKGLDEINFDVSIDNGSLSEFHENKTIPENKTNQFASTDISQITGAVKVAGLGESELKGNDQERIISMFKKLNDAGSNILKQRFPVNIKIQVDNTGFREPLAFIKDGKEKYDAFLENNKSNPQKICDLVKAFNDTVQKADNVISNKDPLQQQAQKQLIMNRFIAVMEEVVKIPTFVDQINKGTFKINPSRERSPKDGTKGIEITSGEYVSTN